jgi:hypothetical protein
MKNEDTVRCIQTNVQRAQKNMGLGFVQESWTIKDQVTGITSKHDKLIYCTNSDRPRASLLINPAISYLSLTKFITRDLASVTIDISTERRLQRIIIA